jgi:hypothetical protein
LGTSKELITANRHFGELCTRRLRVTLIGFNDEGDAKTEQRTRIGSEVQTRAYEATGLIEQLTAAYHESARG